MYTICGFGGHHRLGNRMNFDWLDGWVMVKVTAAGVYPIRGCGGYLIEDIFKEYKTVTVLVIVTVCEM